MKREDLEKLGLSEEQITGVMKLKSGAIDNNTQEIQDLKNEVSTLTTERDNLQTQLNNANNEIKSYKDMDIDSIKKSASDWETKYNELVEKQKAEKEQSIRNERVNEFFKDTKFSSEMAKAGVINAFNQKDFKYDEETKSFQGATEWLNGLKESDKGSFLSDVANPKFTTPPKAPTNTQTNDEIRKIMGLKNEEK